MATNHWHTARTALVPGLALALWLGPAAAQQPTPDEISTIRSSCRSDFMANCSGVTPGGKEALECLQRNAGKLSGPCKSAVSAISAKPAEPAAASPPAAAKSEPAVPQSPTTAKPAAPAKKPVAAARPATPPAAAAAPAVAPLVPMPLAMLPRKRLEIVTICSSEARTLCAGIPPGGGRVIGCLAENASSLSPDCYAAMAAARR